MKCRCGKELTDADPCPLPVGRLCPQLTPGAIMIRGNYSLLNDYQNCPHKAFRRYIAKDVKYIEGPQQAVGNRFHKAMDHRLRSGSLLPQEFERFEYIAAQLEPYKPETELSLGMNDKAEATAYNDPYCWFNGRIDVNIEANNTALLFDWKTGRRREEPFELRIGALLLYIRNPDIRAASGHYFWVNEGPNGTLGVNHDLSDFQRTWAEVDAIMGHIERNYKLNNWPKNQNPLCGYCNVLDCQHNTNEEAKATKL
jgi:PD-(D/E)XK nuclease superfamily